MIGKTRILAAAVSSLPLVAALVSSAAAVVDLRPDSIPRAQLAGPPTAFMNVNVIPMDENRVLRNQTVIVRDGRIVSVGAAASVTIPTGAVRVDGTNKYLMPGLAEMHGHTPVPQGDITQEYVRDMMFLYVANGVTTVRGMLGGNGQLELRRATSTGDILGPNLYLAGPSFSGGSVQSAPQAAQRVRDQKNAGWDLLKIHPGLTVEEYDSIAAVASQVGIRFGGHVPADVGLMRALELGQETFDHLDGMLEYLDAMDKPINRQQLDQMVQMVKAAKAWVVPTMVLWKIGIIGIGNAEEMVAYPEMRYWPAENRPGAEGVNGWARRQTQASQNSLSVAQRELWSNNRNQVLKALSDAGAGVLMGTDSPQMFSVPGFSLHREMQAMADAGMSPYEILVSGTRSVGEYFQGRDSFGTIAVGRRADLILLNSNPLESVANVADRAGVMVRGQWVSGEEIRTGLAALARKHAR